MKVASKKVPNSGYPTTRLRRNRHDDWTRRLVAENRMSVNDLIWPVFVHSGDQQKIEIPTMPNVWRLSINELVKEVGRAKSLGIPLVAVFPVVDRALKTDEAEEAYNKNNLICRAVAAIKKAHDGIGVMCDVALDPYTSHGHDGLLRNGHIVNDETLEILCKQAIVQAKAGCDIIAPSDMMDGRVGAIRAALDTEGFENVRIMAYAAKYASALYGPFRDAVGSAPNLGGGDKKTYQMDPANSDEALREVALDIQEGADMVMVKPGLFYLDILQRVKNQFMVPTFAYQVSGEYAMLKTAGKQGLLNEEQVMAEALLSFKRAGADGILTYAALEYARYLD